MQLDDVLQCDDVHLALGASDRDGAVSEVLAKLHGDARVKDWTALRDAVLGHEMASLDTEGGCVCIAHGRCQALTDLVVAAGRSERGLVCGEGKVTRLVFVAGIPTAMNSQYLRVVGAIARVCSRPAELNRLLATKSPEEFVARLQAACERLD